MTASDYEKQVVLAPLSEIERLKQLINEAQRDLNLSPTERLQLIAETREKIRRSIEDYYGRLWE